jgi:hypothetical protein
LVIVLLLVQYLQTPTRGGATVFPQARRTVATETSAEAAESPQRQEQQQQRRSSRRLRDDETEAIDDEQARVVNAAVEQDVDDVDVVAGEEAGATNLALLEAELPVYCRDDGNYLKILPEVGDAVFFFGYRPGEPGQAAAPDVPASVHAGCPPLEGTKVIATRWMRSAEFT